MLQAVMEGAGNEMLKVIPCLTEAKIGKDWSFKKDKHRFGLRDNILQSIFDFQKGLLSNECVRSLSKPIFF